MTAAASPSGGAEAVCDHTSVGVLVSGPGGLLVFERVRPPAGLAPVAGHVDRHGGPERAARAEVAEEVGLTVVRLRPLLTGWRPNRCRRTSTGPVGHRWWVFEAETRGVLRPSAAEVRAPRWLGPGELRCAARRTVSYAEGRVERAEFERRPGLEPVWCRFLHGLGLLELSPSALGRIDTIL